MPGDLIIFDLGKLGAAAKTLIERIAGAGWVLYEPQHIKRVATAEVAAERIRALGHIETSAAVERALLKLAHEEERRQRNVAQVTAGAIPLLEADAKPQDVDEDWLAFLFERAKLVSDAEMQSLWSKILAGEVNSPGAFSRHTLQVVSGLDKRDAHLITALCRFAWTMGPEPMPVVNDVQAKIYVDAGITFAALTHLDALGVLRFDNGAGFRLEGLPKNFEISYFDTRFRMELPVVPWDLQVGKVLLTSVGKELVRISGASPVDGFPEHCIEKFWARTTVTATRLG